MPATMAGVVNTARAAVAAARASHRWRRRLLISGPFQAAGCRHACFGARHVCGWLPLGLLHALRAGSSTGGGAGSRVLRGEEVRSQGAGSLGSVGTSSPALDADPAPVTLPVRREGAHPARAAAT